MTLNQRVGGFCAAAPVRVDFRRAEAYRGEDVIELSAKEFKLLSYMIATVSTRTVDVHVVWLRQKLESNQRHPQFILTIHGTGYKFSG